MRDTSVYVHFPWCAKKCPYCDFATRKIDVATLPHEAYADALLRELEVRRGALRGRRLTSVFFGGGTPSLWSGAALGRVLAAIRGAFEEESEALEITAESNPNSLTRARAAAFAEAGVGRLSLGVQSLDDARLRFLGRLHDRTEALTALGHAAAAVERVSADLMFGMPGQSADDLAREIDQLLEAGVRHVSAYALTIEPGTQFGELHRLGKLRVAEEEAYAQMFERAERAFEAAGFAHYEGSNYAQPGEEARHNLHYWRGGDYLGLGAAAVGCLSEADGGARRWKNTVDAGRYMEALGEEESETLGPQDRIREGLMLGLRMAEGVDGAALSARAGVDWRRGREAALARRLERGDVVLEGERLRVPRERWLLLDGIVADLF